MSPRRYEDLLKLYGTVGKTNLSIDLNYYSKIHKRTIFVENNTNQVLWAKIYLRNMPIERILEHEMGHALGFLHIDKPGHIMNEVWVDGGWGDDGLRVR